MGMTTVNDLVAAVDAEAKRRQKRPFADLEGDVQDEILRDIQTGAIRGFGMVFDTLLTLSFEGYLAAPTHGGNHDRVAWRWLGIDPGCGGGTCGEMENPK